MRVVVEGVSKVYGDRAGHAVHALDGIDLAVNTEEFVAVLGPSGCGKSTLLNLIAGLLAPTEGAIWLDGELPPGRAATAMVFQEFALFPWRTVQANVEFFPWADAYHLVVTVRLCLVAFDSASASELYNFSV